MDPRSEFKLGPTLPSPVPELAEPGEGLGGLHLLQDELGHHVPGVDVDGADGHDALAVGLGELAQ